MYPFKAGCFAPKNAWYVAAFQRDVGREIVSRVILNEPVILYRTEAGVITALGGRCPHRHFPLGESCLRADDVVCGYHGISFGPDGACTSIPSQGVVPSSYRVPKYPVVEHGLWVWIWMGDAEKADPALLPDLKDIRFSLPGVFTRPIAFAEIKGRYQLMNDNLLDLSHLAVLHGTSIGTIENASTPEEMERSERVLRSSRKMKNIPVAPMLKAIGVNDERIDRLAGMDFYAPGFHAGIDESRKVSDGDLDGELIVGGFVYHAVTPSTPTTCYYFFASGAMDEAQLDFTEKSIGPVLDEDIFASEEIEKMLQLLGEFPKELMLKSDTNAVLGRRMIQAMMDAELSELTASSGATASPGKNPEEIIRVG